MGSIASNLAKLTAVTSSMQLLDVVTSERINAIQEILKDLVTGENIRSGENIRRTSGPGWFMISANPKGRSVATAAVSTEPFTVVIGEAVEGGVSYTLVPGTLNNLLPANMFDSFIYTPGGFSYVKVCGYSDGAKMTSVAIVADGNAPIIQEPLPFTLPYLVEILVGIIYTDGDGEIVTARTIGSGVLSLSGSQQFAVDKDPPAPPGVLPYTPYYAWS